MARYRDFRGQRKTTIPSHFLMELPRQEMELVAPQVDRYHVDESYADEAYDEEPTFEEPVLSQSGGPSAPTSFGTG